jgi:hypothetical protein
MHQPPDRVELIGAALQRDEFSISSRDELHAARR